MKITYGKKSVNLSLPRYDDPAWREMIDQFAVTMMNPLVDYPSFDEESFSLIFPYKGKLSNIAMVGLKNCFTKEYQQIYLKMKQFFYVSFVSVMTSKHSNKGDTTFCEFKFLCKEFSEHKFTRISALIRHIVKTEVPESSYFTMYCSSTEDVYRLHAVVSVPFIVGFSKIEKGLLKVTSFDKVMFHD